MDTKKKPGLPDTRPTAAQKEAGGVQDAIRGARSQANIPKGATPVFNIGGKMYNVKGERVSDKDIKNLIKGGKKVAMVEPATSTGRPKRNPAKKPSTRVGKRDKDFLASLDDVDGTFSLTTDIIDNPRGFTGISAKNERDAGQLKKLKDKGLLSERKIGDLQSEYKITDKGRKLIGRGVSAKGIINKMPKNLGLASSKERAGFINDLAGLSLKELNRALNQSINDMTSGGPNDLPRRNAMILSEWIEIAGKRAAKRAAKAPALKGDLTEKAQNDAPNYMAASDPRRCDNCRFFLGDPGRDWCERFDFTADPDYICDAWEAQKPDLIPGYMANKSQFAGVMAEILRSKYNNLT